MYTNRSISYNNYFRITFNSINSNIVRTSLCTLLSGLLLEPRLCYETTSRDVFWSYIIMVNLFIVLLIEYVSSIRSVYV